VVTNRIPSRTYVPGAARTYAHTALRAPDTPLNRITPQVSAGVIGSHFVATASLRTKPVNRSANSALT
jgi:hypothetical protein